MALFNRGRISRRAYLHARSNIWVLRVVDAESATASVDSYLKLLEALQAADPRPI